MDPAPAMRSRAKLPSNLSKQYHLSSHDPLPVTNLTSVRLYVTVSIAKRSLKAPAQLLERVSER